ncbi:NeuD/PglB/VioB family sugar acetyltransferase [Campylobacter suis]|uniref:UDP-N-acetylbacillosamine N-acetyltransferase n=1 Tax=Campylobacter suis TaxID=2790657 RepID=A0ABN7K863_9BACT|nr:NeuD/PglB/VioB family sugar acetyltransferase [Campylobacter suis]CAD7288709.1 UDP-N-acetylbacillosamine N-acetyltransferase [Campylobacter suis]
MKENIVLIGGGGHARSCIDVIELENRFNIIGIVDNGLKKGTKVLDYEVLGSDSDLPEIFKICKNALICIGQIKTPEPRIKAYELALSLGFKLPSIISPLAYVSKYADVQDSSIIMHHAFINAGAKIGKNCIINSKALIEHDAVIGDHCHISTASVINGGVSVGAKSFFGSNSTSKEYVNIDENSIIGGGTSVFLARKM